MPACVFSDTNMRLSDSCVRTIAYCDVSKPLLPICPTIHTVMHASDVRYVRVAYHRQADGAARVHAQTLAHTINVNVYECTLCIYTIPCKLNALLGNTNIAGRVCAGIAV